MEEAREEVRLGVMKRLIAWCHDVLTMIQAKEVYTCNNTQGCLVCYRPIVIDERDEACVGCDLVSQFNAIRSRICSETCYLRYLKFKRDESSSSSMRCLFQGCSKPRYCDVTTGELKDYCGRSHAVEHKEKLAAIWIQRPHHTLSYNETSRCRAILFYDKHDPYYEFTNFSHYPVVIEGVFYPTTEHYFQSQKLIGTPFCSKIAELPSPREAFEYPRQQGVREWVRKGWESVKDDVMYRALYHKFIQHENLLLLLLSTGNLDLIEHSPYDSYWGDGPDGRGQNKLGKQLMCLRHFLHVTFLEEQKHFSTGAVPRNNLQPDMTTSIQHNHPLSSDATPFDSNKQEGDNNASQSCPRTTQLPMDVDDNGAPAQTVGLNYIAQLDGNNSTQPQVPDLNSFNDRPDNGQPCSDGTSAQPDSKLPAQTSSDIVPSADAEAANEASELNIEVKSHGPGDPFVS